MIVIRINRDRITRHHLLPISRGGPDEEWNIRRVPWWLQSLWHSMFNILLPEEIIRQILWCLPFDHHDVMMLVMYNGRQVTLSKDRDTLMTGVGRMRRALRRVLQSHEPIEMLTAWLRDWVPAGYFTQATILYRGERIDLLERVGPERKVLPYFRVRLHIHTPKLRPPKITKGRTLPQDRQPRRWNFAVERKHLEAILHGETSFPD